MAPLFQVNARELARLLVLLLLVLGQPFPLRAAAPAANAPAAKPKPAALKITGYGFLGNRDLARRLRALELGGRKPEYFIPTFVEDAALILSARVKQDGYLRPAISVRLRLAEGGRWLELDTEELMENPLPRSVRFSAVEFEIHKGRLYYFEQLDFTGLASLNEKQARSYFIETGPLIHLKRMRIYTPERMRRGLASVKEMLERQGYQEASATVSHLERNDQTGAVRAQIQVRQGPRFVVHSVKELRYEERAGPPVEKDRVLRNPAYSQVWRQDYELSVRTNLYRRGYPDAAVGLETLGQRAAGTNVELELLARITNGPQARIGEVRFEGQKRTRPWLMSRRVRVRRGELLDRTRVELGRYRLSQLGIFDRVDLRYEPGTGPTRDVVYQVHEGKTRDLSLLFGYGSYELLRVGLEGNLYNLWGLAHEARAKAIQSFKASSGDFTYTIPDAVGRDIDVFLHASGLRREEISFTREEYGGGIGAHRFFKRFATDTDLRYNYQILNAVSTIPQIGSEGLTNPAVGSITATLKLDRRDNPLYPRRGYKVFLTCESATDYLGGEANYERAEVSSAWHHGLGGGRWLNLGLSHGVAVSFGSPAQNLPFSRRFFPGGENSIRGYQEGEAAPRNAQGQLVGAESYGLASVELEQALTPRWSVVFFSDSLGAAHRLEAYPFDSGLFSVGIGLRWRTLIGPVRLEYGHNLNPRRQDPAGTVQFSLGFPF